MALPATAPLPEDHIARSCCPAVRRRRLPSLQPGRHLQEVLQWVAALSGAACTTAAGGHARRLRSVLCTTPLCRSAPLPACPRPSAAAIGYVQVGSRCVSCPSGCNACTAAGVCTKCSGGYYLADGKCHEVQGECPGGGGKGGLRGGLAPKGGCECGLRLGGCM